MDIIILYWHQLHTIFTNTANTHPVTSVLLGAKTLPYMVTGVWSERIWWCRYPGGLGTGKSLLWRPGWRIIGQNGDDIHAHVLRRTCTVHSHLHTIMAISFFCALFCGWVCQSCSELTHYSPASVCYFAWRLIDSRNWVFAFSINHHDSTTALTSQPWQVVATEDFQESDTSILYSVPSYRCLGDYRRV